MSKRPYSWEEANYRLMHYKGTIYKFKIEFSCSGPGKSPVQGALTPAESLQIDRAVGVLVHGKYRRTGKMEALQTADFLIKCLERPWKIGRKVGFRLRGKELAVHDFMLLLNVVPKQRRRVTAVNGSVSLTDKPHTRSTHSQGKIGQCGSAKNSTTENRPSSSQQGHDPEQTTADRLRKEAQAPEPPPRLISTRQQRRKPSSRQMESRLSPRKGKESSKNVRSPQQMQKSHELSPRQLRKSSRLLLSVDSPVQVQRSPTVSSRQLHSTANSSATANSSVQEMSPKQLRQRPDVSPRIFHDSSRFHKANSSRGGHMKSPEKHVTPEISSRVLRKNIQLDPVRSCENDPMESSENHVIPEVSARPLRRSPRFCPVRSSQRSPPKSPKRTLGRSPRLSPIRSSQSSPLKSPVRCEILDNLIVDPSKPRQRSHSIGSEDNHITKRLRSNSAKLPTSDVAAIEKLLHPLDKEFVRREYEQEELRLLKLAKPSTTSAERRVWLSCV